MSLTASSQRSPLYKWLVILFILAIAAFSIIPNYVTNQWVWEQSPKLRNIAALRTLQQQGLSLAGWETLDQQVVEIGGHKWSYQSMSPTSNPAVTSTATLETDMPQNIVLLLRPQTWHRDLPQVDWMDINGVQGWTEDSQHQIQFTTTPVETQPMQTQPEGTEQRSIQVSARFFRGWNQERTFAVLQWYAWPTGGSPAPSSWFWVDQASQWQKRQHTPWIAVSLLFPIKPLADIKTVQPQAETLGQLVQSSLIAQVGS